MLTKNVWKSLFDLMSDDDLRYVARQSRIKVKGFREVTSAIPRAMLATAMTATDQLSKVRSFLNRYTQGEDELEAYRSMNKQELLDALRAGKGPFDVLFALLSSPENDQQMLGEVLFNDLELTGELAKRVEAFYAREKEQAEDTEVTQTEATEATEKPQADDSTDHRIVRKLEKKYDTLKQQYDSLLAEYQEKRKEWDLEIKDLRQQARDKQTLEGQYRKLQDERKTWNDTQESLQKELNHKHAQLKNMEKEQEQLLHEKEELTAKVEALTQALEQQGGAKNAAQVVSRVGRQPLIVLIGKPSKNNLDVVAARDDITLLDVDLVEQELEGLLPTATQVWMLTYETPFPKQRKIRQLVERDRLKEFRDYLGLKSHINR
ncbi:MAG TPA: hypothetical protein VFV52_09870 [Bacilli bacterium]|nr:hypothetical protein [Bacilli bacterium]